jgi:hypothetical protein
MTDFNMRGIFELCTGRCGHKWVAAVPYVFACPVCGDQDNNNSWAEHVVAREPIVVRIAYVWDKLERRRARAIRENRRRPRRPRKTATVVSLTARRFQRSAEADGQRPEP